MLADNASGNIVARRDLERAEAQRAGWLLFDDAAYAQNSEEFTLFFQLEVEALFIKFHDEQVRYLPPPTVFIVDSEKASSTPQRIVDLSMHSRRVCELFLTWMDLGMTSVPECKSAEEFCIPGLDAAESQHFFAEIWGVAIQHKFYNITANVAKGCSAREFWTAAHAPDFNRLQALYNLMLPSHDDMSKASTLVDYAFENWESLPDTATFPLRTAIRSFVRGDKEPPADCLMHVLKRLQANRLHTLERVLLTRLCAPDWMLHTVFGGTPQTQTSSFN